MVILVDGVAIQFLMVHLSIYCNRRFQTRDYGVESPIYLHHKARLEALSATLAERHLVQIHVGSTGVKMKIEFESSRDGYLLCCQEYYNGENISIELKIEMRWINIG